MSKSTTTVLLTGFGPFPGVPVNVSAIFAQQLSKAARRNFPYTEFICATLPTLWMEAPALVDRLYFEHRPSISLHFGVSHLAHAMTIECAAHNLARRPDAVGAVPAYDLLVPDGPSERLATLPTARIVARLQRKSIPAVLSHDAGDYLCNAILYHSLDVMQTMGISGHCGFVHLPLRLPLKSANAGQAGYAPLTWEKAVHGGLEIIATLLQRPARLPMQASRQSIFV